MTTKNFLLIAWVLILGAIRVAGEKDQAFQAAAHMTVASLVVAWKYERPSGGRLFFWLAVGLTVLEVICFIAGR